MNKQEFEQLAERISYGTASQADVEWYNTWFATFNDTSTWDTAELGEPSAIKNHLFIDISSEIKRREKTRVRSLYYKVTAAASILLVLSSGAYFIFQKKITKSDQGAVAYHDDIAPGQSRATLTLANGQKIVLTTGLQGRLAIQGGTSITANGSGLSYIH